MLRVGVFLIVASPLFGHGVFASTDQIPKSKCEGGLALPANVMVSRGDLVITYDSQVFWKGQKITIGSTKIQNQVQLRLLLALVDSANQPVSIEDLYYDAWVHVPPGNEPNEKKVRAAIASIRQSFREVDEHFNSIGRGVYGRSGYQWQDDLP